MGNGLQTLQGILMVIVHSCNLRNGLCYKFRDIIMDCMRAIEIHPAQYGFYIKECSLFLRGSCSAKGLSWVPRYFTVDKKQTN